MKSVDCPHCGTRTWSHAIVDSRCPTCQSKLTEKHPEASSRPTPQRSQAPGSPDNGSGHAKPARELLLRFPCPSCDRWLTVPIRSLGLAECCPACRNDLVIPTLDESVAGLDILHQCAGFGKGRVSDFATAFTTKALPPEANITTPKTPPAPPPPPPKQRVTEPAAIVRRAKEKDSDRPTPPPRRDPASPFFRERKNDTSEHPSSDTPFAADYMPEHKAAKRQAAHWQGYDLSPRVTRYVVWGCIWAAPFLPAVLYGLSAQRPEAFAGLFCCLAVPWYFVAPYVGYICVPYVLAALYRSVRCPGCGESHQLVSQWSCGCGYNDHRQRHLYLFRCPNCRRCLGRFNCTVCDCTILL